MAGGRGDGQLSDEVRAVFTGHSVAARRQGRDPDDEAAARPSVPASIGYLVAGLQVGPPPNHLTVIAFEDEPGARGWRPLVPGERHVDRLANLVGHYEGQGAAVVILGQAFEGLAGLAAVGGRQPHCRQKGQLGVGADRVAFAVQAPPLRGNAGGDRQAVQALRIDTPGAVAGCRRLGQDQDGTRRGHD